MSARATSEVQHSSSVIMAAQSSRVEALVRETHELVKAGVTDVKEYEGICMNAQIEVRIDRVIYMPRFHLRIRVLILQLPIALDTPKQNTGRPPAA